MGQKQAPVKKWAQVSQNMVTQIKSFWVRLWCFVPEYSQIPNTNIPSPDLYGFALSSRNRLGAHRFFARIAIQQFTSQPVMELRPQWE